MNYKSSSTDYVRNSQVYFTTDPDHQILLRNIVQTTVLNYDCNEDIPILEKLASLLQGKDDKTYSIMSIMVSGNPFRAGRPSLTSFCLRSFFAC